MTMFTEETYVINFPIIEDRSFEDLTNIYGDLHFKKATLDSPWKRAEREIQQELIQAVETGEHSTLTLELFEMAATDFYDIDPNVLLNEPMAKIDLLQTHNNRQTTLKPQTKQLLERALIEPPVEQYIAESKRFVILNSLIYKLARKIHTKVDEGIRPYHINLRLFQKEEDISINALIIASQAINFLRKVTHLDTTIAEYATPAIVEKAYQGWQSYKSY